MKVQVDTKDLAELEAAAEQGQIVAQLLTAVVNKSKGKKIRITTSQLEAAQELTMTAKAEGDSGDILVEVVS